VTQKFTPHDEATVAREDTKAMLAGKIGANGYREGSVDGSRSLVAADSRSRSRCNCCGKRETHVGLGDGLALMGGCEMRVRRWVRDGRKTYADRDQSAVKSTS
jgi:hypothetical protein